MRERGNRIALQCLAFAATMGLFFSFLGAKANVLTSADLDRVTEVFNSSVAIKQDLSSSTKTLIEMTPTPTSLDELVRSHRTMNCMRELNDWLLQAGVSIHALVGFTVIGVGMRDKRDEAVANKVTGLFVQGALASLEALRGSANAASASCAESALVNTNTQDILNFVREATKVIKPIGKRLGVDQ